MFTRTDRLPLQPSCMWVNAVGRRRSREASEQNETLVRNCLRRKELEPSGACCGRPFVTRARKPADPPLWLKEPCNTAITADKCQACNCGAGCLISWQ